MCRLLRILLNAATLLSLSLCVVAGALSARHFDQADLVLGGRHWHASSYRGRFTVDNVKQVLWEEQAARAQAHRLAANEMRFVARNMDRMLEPEFSAAIDAAQRHIDAAESLGSTTRHVRYSVSHATAIAWTGCLPALRLCAFAMARPRRVPRGRCAACDYDLRATPGRCPECGNVPTK